MTRFRIFFFIVLFFPFSTFSQQLFRGSDGFIHFNSNASLEIIDASSKNLSGVIKQEDKTFAFLVSISSFEGFNAALQREHFNENYMESSKYKTATFTGKIIEDIDFAKDSVYQVRAKGILNIHGVEQERIIKSTITISHKILIVESQFSVFLKDHNIKVPKVVHEKIASEIIVTIKAILKSDQ